MSYFTLFHCHACACEIGLPSLFFVAVWVLSPPPTTPRNVLFVELESTGGGKGQHATPGSNDGMHSIRGARWRRCLYRLL